MPANRYITTLADCAELTSLQVLMGRDGAYKGVYSRMLSRPYTHASKNTTKYKC